MTVLRIFNTENFDMPKIMLTFATKLKETMTKIPFDIKYKHHILTGKAEVVTRSGLSVEILKWDVNSVDYPILGLVVEENVEVPTSWTLEGREYGAGDADLFIIIPDPELTEFEKAVEATMTLGYGDGETPFKYEEIKQQSELLLELAKEELPKREWPEEDAKMLKLSVELFDRLGGDRYGGAYTLEVGFEEMEYRDCADWLKSLKCRYTWKPSEEQMIALRLASQNDILANTTILQGLYNDLKKLN